MMSRINQALAILALGLSTLLGFNVDAPPPPSVQIQGAAAALGAVPAAPASAPQAPAAPWANLPIGALTLWWLNEMRRKQGEQAAAVSKLNDLLVQHLNAHVNTIRRESADKPEAEGASKVHSDVDAA